MAVDIASSLGIGSGINTTQLVADLTNASFQPRQNAAQTRMTTANARISALASATSSLTTFSSALTELLKNTSYSGQPVSNDASVATVGTIAGGVPKGLPAQLEVRQLASAQVLQSPSLANATAVAGTGTLKLTIGGVEKMITVGGTGTLSDLASSINSANAGVTASIVTDTNGSRLVLKGGTGVANAFTLTAEADADADLQRFVWDGSAGTMSRSQVATNAQIRIDNVDMEFASNEVTTAIPYLRISLNSAKPGTTVTLATDQPTSTMTDLVGEFVSAYNQLKTGLNTATKSNPTAGTVGLLTSDSGLREMSRRLSGLVSAELTTSGPYRRLSDIGVSTSRDGTLTIDSAKLNAALAADPEAIVQMLNPTAPSPGNTGIAGALKTITDQLNGTDGPLASSRTIYNKQRDALQKELDKLSEQRTNYSERLTVTYAAMQSRLVQFQATQSYLKQQVAIWNGGGD